MLNVILKFAGLGWIVFCMNALAYGDFADPDKAVAGCILLAAIGIVIAMPLPTDKGE